MAIVMKDKTSTACIKLANELDLELIPDDKSGLWCYRPVIRDDEGREVVRYRPDPCEFKYSLSEVKAQLGMLRVLKKAMMVVFHERP